MKFKEKMNFDNKLVPAGIQNISKSLNYFFTDYKTILKIFTSYVWIIKMKNSQNKLYDKWSIA